MTTHTNTNSKDSINDKHCTHNTDPVTVVVAEFVVDTREPSESHPSTKSLTAFQMRNMNEPQKNADSLIL